MMSNTCDASRCLWVDSSSLVRAETMPRTCTLRRPSPGSGPSTSKRSSPPARSGRTGSRAAQALGTARCCTPPRVRRRRSRQPSRPRRQPILCGSGYRVRAGQGGRAARPPARPVRKCGQRKQTTHQPDTHRSTQARPVVEPVGEQQGQRGAERGQRFRKRAPTRRRRRRRHRNDECRENADAASAMRRPAYPVAMIVVAPMNAAPILMRQPAVHPRDGRTARASTSTTEVHWPSRSAVARRVGRRSPCRWPACSRASGSRCRRP